MLLYHNPRTCGQQPVIRGTLLDTGAHRNQPDDRLDVNQDSSSEIAIDDNDSDEDAMPFELTQSELEAIVGENNTVGHSLEQKVHVDLLHILETAEAPDYLFQEVVEWASRSRAMGYNFSPSIISRHAVLNNIRQHFNLQGLRPTISELKLESVNQNVPIVCFEFYQLLISLLTEVSLMQPDNLVINSAITLDDGSLDVNPWFQPFVPSNSSLDEVLSGKWYKDTVEKLNATSPSSNIFVCPLIFYVDKTFIDPTKSRFNLEPINFTLGIFKRSCRTLFRFWRTLGFLPDVPDEDVLKPLQGCKYRNYHKMLKFILQGVLELQKDNSRLDNFPI